MADPEVEKFKVWPTQADRSQLQDVILAGSKKQLESRYPLNRQKYARQDDPRPQMVEAYLYFYEELAYFFTQGEDNRPIKDLSQLPAKLEECFQALRNILHVVVIDLEPGDDAQVIFETLNARGEPLLPADLLRNFIFLRAGRKGEPQEALYAEFWQKFDDDFWRQEIRQGRLSRPRSDLFMQHFLASRQMVDVPVRNLFVEYKHWIENKKPFDTVRDELGALSRQGDHFRRLISPQQGDFVCPLASFLNAFDISSAYPLLLFFLASDVSTNEWQRVATIIESYFMRRAVCDLSTKNYTRTALSLIRGLHRDGMSADNLNRHLSELKMDSAEWPSDERFCQAWKSQNAYHTLNNPKMVHILKRLSNEHFDPKKEVIKIDCELTVEHIMPREWIQRWPLPSGETGLTPNELSIAQNGDARAEATRRRNAAIHTLGNLTILTQPLNSSVSNAPWKEKRPELLKHSLLSINQALHSFDVWDEDAIEKRGRTLLDQALRIWPKSL